VDRDALLKWQPVYRFNAEPDGERIAVGGENGCVVLEWPGFNFKNANPSRKLRHIADESISAFDALSDTALPWVETGDRAIRFRERLIRRRREEIQIVGHKSSMAMPLLAA
jgi:hypothetical protein